MVNPEFSMIEQGICKNCKNFSNNLCSVLNKKEGMNAALKMLDITYRIDRESGRRRVNKTDSQLDRIQKKEGKYFYI